MTLRRDAATARSETLQGVRRLFALASRADLQRHADWLPRRRELAAALRGLPAAESLENALVDLLADRAFLAEGCTPHDRFSYEKQLSAGREQLPVAAQEIAQWVAQVIAPLAALRKLLASPALQADMVRYAVHDVEGQLCEWFFNQALTHQPWSGLLHYPRYLTAARLRLERLEEHVQRDKSAFANVYRWRRAIESVKKNSRGGNDAAAFVAALEEYRVAAFAPELGQSFFVDERFLTKCLEQVRRVESSVNAAPDSAAAT